VLSLDAYHNLTYRSTRHVLLTRAMSIHSTRLREDAAPEKSVRFTDDAPHRPRSSAALVDDRASNGSNNLFAESTTSIAIPLDDSDLKYEVSDSRDQSDVSFTTFFIRVRFHQATSNHTCVP
jgi:hypothetical protein